MTSAFLIPDEEHYWLTNGHISASLLDPAICPDASQLTPEGLTPIHLEIQSGQIKSLSTGGVPLEPGIPAVDLRGGMVWPCFVDMHTHLDKGHIWPRQPNTAGTFDNACEAVWTDRSSRWTEEDVYARMGFGLRCSYAHGTQAIRTHIDSINGQGAISLRAFWVLQQEWQGRIQLQASSLIPTELYMLPEGEAIANLVAETPGGILGALTEMGPALDVQLDRIMALAVERGLDLDFHTDESGDPSAITLRHVAQAVLRNHFPHRVTCGHCCSLAVQPQGTVKTTLELVKAAGIGIVSLPMCNLFLQNRDPGYTPRWRGVTLLHELRRQGIPVAVSSDNCRDPFFGFGDHDVLEVFTQSTRIAHLDTPYGTWPQAVTLTPAELMGLSTVQPLKSGSPADLVLCRGRTFSEVLSRAQFDRVVLRQGQAIDTTLPDYAELDAILA